MPLDGFSVRGVFVFAQKTGKATLDIGWEKRYNIHKRRALHIDATGIMLCNAERFVDDYHRIQNG